MLKDNRNKAGEFQDSIKIHKRVKCEFQKKRTVNSVIQYLGLIAYEIKMTRELVMALFEPYPYLIPKLDKDITQENKTFDL